MCDPCAQVHPYWRNDDLLKGMKELGIHVTAYSPLGSEVKDQPSLLQDETLKKVRSWEFTPLLISLTAFAKAADSLACAAITCCGASSRRVAELPHVLMPAAAVPVSAAQPKWM